MKVAMALVAFYCSSATGQITIAPYAKTDPKLQADIRRVMEYELDLVLRADVSNMERFYPDDMVVTNPFNQLIDKPKVLERVRGNIIRYSSYEKRVEYLHPFSDSVVVMGLEVVKATADASRPDAGKVTRRRFTEVWTRRGSSWQKIVRHANNME